MLTECLLFHIKDNENHIYLISLDLPEMIIWGPSGLKMKSPDHHQIHHHRLVPHPDSEVSQWLNQLLKKKTDLKKCNTSADLESFLLGDWLIDSSTHVQLLMNKHAVNE